MKVTYLKIKNIGLVADEKIEFNMPLILLYGQIRQGKTTFLNAVRWVCGGSFPDDIIRHGEKEAFIELGFDGGLISREFYVGKGGVKAREVVFIRGGKPVNSPVAEIKRFLNPFLIDQDHLRKMTDLERKKFFTELFAVDTTDLDTEAFNKDREATQLRATVKGYGEIDLTPVETVDVEALRRQLDVIRLDHKVKADAVIARNRSTVDQNNLIARKKDQQEALRTRMAELSKALTLAEDAAKELTVWLEEHPVCTLNPEPNPPNTSDLENKISQAAANEVRVEQFKKNQERAKQKSADEQKLSVIEARQREIKKEKIAKLTGVTDSCGIKDLKFDEAGNFTYQDTDAGMLSTSQIMRLSSELSALYPEGFGIELLDRGESLGISIFEFVERAKAEEKTILATIVGEAPAKVPSDVGVFVVEGGKAKKAVKAEQKELV